MSETTPETTTPPAEPETPNPQGDPAGDQPLGENGVKALKAERERADAAERELKTLRAAQMSDLERAQAEAREAREQLAKVTTQNLRNSVALAKGVPADLVEFLTGDTEDEIAAKADVLLSRITPVAPTPKPDRSQGAKGAPQPSSTADQFAAALEQAFTS